MTVAPKVLTVSQLNRHVRSYLEYEMGDVCVEGEISNVTKPASGHFYFTLKDATAQIRCVYFRNRHALSDARGLQNGQHVLAQGQLSLYEARGDYQLIVGLLTEAGQGDLYRQFELLKTKLAALGLFDAARKKNIPRIPRCIGIITSASGAALHDMLTTLARRFPLVPVLVYASDVQGKQAATQLIQTLQRTNREQRCDVIILARGGGSIEDLWAFNDEQLAYAIVNSTIPIVSGIGHETDVTLADFVADIRAATPTAAAETVVPDWRDLMRQVSRMQESLSVAITRVMTHKTLLFSHQMQQLASPARLISSYWQTLDHTRYRLSQSSVSLLVHKKHQLQRLTHRLEAHHPRMRLQQARARLVVLEAYCHQHMGLKMISLTQTVRTLGATLHAVSPLATLDRGYAIATHDNHVLTDCSHVSVGDTIDIRLANGTLVCEVTG